LTKWRARQIWNVGQIPSEKISASNACHQNNRRDGTVLIAYGNGSSATGSAHYADDIQKVAALDVFILEYPGYEDRPGKPTEKNLFAAAVDAFQMLPTNKPVYLVGESLGTGVAAYLAGTFSNKISGVLLISPFDSLVSPAQYQYPWLPVSLLLVDRFPSENYLRNYHGKIGITVDGKDDVVPEKFGLKLYDGYGGPKKLWQFPNGGHCEITEPQNEFWKELFEFLQTNSNKHNSFGVGYIKSSFESTRFCISLMMMRTRSSTMSCVSAKEYDFNSTRTVAIGSPLRSSNG
jgi:pimeloyl-ACP methyl ester carboxylesterase